MIERVWEPLEWQTHCRLLLNAKYSVRVQLIPDRDQGDGGLEAYVPDEEAAFQCYAPMSPKTVGAQTEAQKNKIYSDTKKLLDEPARTCAIIGPGRRIRSWVLLTPTYDSKDLIQYANKRARKIREDLTSSAWCASDFTIVIHDDSLFATERNRLYGSTTFALQAATSTMSTEEVAERADTEPDIGDVLDRKFRADPRLNASQQLLQDYKGENLRDYFRGDAELVRLQNDYPLAHSGVARAAEIVFNGLARSIAESDARPLVVVKGLREQLEARLREEVPGIGAELLAVLSNYFIASWWIQCPLQFEGQAVA